MLRLYQGVRSGVSVVITQSKRNIAASAVVAQKADPIQQLFLNKIKDYSQKSAKAGGGLVDGTATEEKALQDELDKITSGFSVKGQDFTAFPTFSFSDPVIQPVGLGNIAQPDAVNVAEELDSFDEEYADKPYWEP